MKVRNKRDLNAGLMFMAIGAVFAACAQEYPLGTANRMGPGYFPTILAVLMFLLGFVIVLMAFLDIEAQEPPEPSDWRGLGWVLGSVIAFALLLPYAGFVISVFGLVCISSIPSEDARRLETLILAGALAVLGVLVFGVGLELQFPILPPALTQ